MSERNAAPAAEYRSRQDAWQNIADQFAGRDAQFSTARGILFLIALLVLYLAVQRTVSGWWLVGLLGVFVVLAVIHEFTVRRMKQARQAVDYYKNCTRRLNGDWLHVGIHGDRYLDPSHPYSGDLDVFGRGSLFQLLCQARTRLGEDTLADWLMRPNDVATLQSRQAGVRELKANVDVREELSLLTAECHDELNQNELRDWAAEPSHDIGHGARIAASAFGVLAGVVLIAWLAGLVPFTFLLGLILLELPFLALFRHQIKDVALRIDQAGSGLAILAQVLDVLERQQFEHAHLRQLRSKLDVDGVQPSQQIARLHVHIRRLNNSMRNQFFVPFAILFCLHVHIIHAIERWREVVGPHIDDWLNAVGELEALSSLAGYAYEQEDNVFPVLCDDLKLEAVGLGHPLLSADQCVRNDFSIGDELRLVLISGSNMSGKSTLLRTIGTNTVLALAGAPVRATSMTLSPVQIGSAMRISDSLQDGKSLFYAVIGRLKSVVELADGQPPLFFLLDEILQGTNSHDRRVGAEGVIRSLVEHGAIGLVTTHDLALTDIVDSLGQRARNVHFEDHLVDGKMTFDYTLREGVVQKSNALELMRMMGLDV